MHPFLTLPISTRLFVDAILNDQSIVPSFYEGVKVQEVIEASARSNQQGRRIEVGHLMQEATDDG